MDNESYDVSLELALICGNWSSSGGEKQGLVGHLEEFRVFECLDVAPAFDCCC